MTLSVRGKSLVFTYTFTQAENPEKLREMVAKSGAHSTDLQSPETVEHLCAKCGSVRKGLAAGSRQALDALNGNIIDVDDDVR